MKKEITQEYLKEVLNYNEHTGIFTWKEVNNTTIFGSEKTTKMFNSKCAGKEAGNKEPSGYIRIHIRGKSYKAHLLVFLHVYGYIPTEFVSHINKNLSDNRLCNLKEHVDIKENSNNIEFHDILKETLSYDKETGLFTWLVRPLRHFNNKHAMNSFNSIKPGSEAGTENNNGYIAIEILGNVYLGHRLAWFMEHGYWPKNNIDHIDGNKSNNKIKNLREATGSENIQNLKKAMSNNKLGVLGVFYNKKSCKYQAQIGLNGKVTILGLFDSVDEASNAYISAKRTMHTHGTL